MPGPNLKDVQSVSGEHFQDARITSDNLLRAYS